MKLSLVLLTAAVLVAGCGSATHATTTPSANGTVFTNRTHHFALTYDPGVFRATTKTIGGQFNLRLSYLGGDGHVLVVVVPTSTVYVRYMLAEWGKGSPGWGKTSNIANANQWALLTLNLSYVR